MLYGATRPLRDFDIGPEHRNRVDDRVGRAAYNRAWRAEHRDEYLARRRARYAELRAAGLSGLQAAARR